MTDTPSATICFAPSGPVRRTYLNCPTCERRRRFVIRFGGVWYDDTATCCSCGDSWTGGEMMPRPFQRGWRGESIREAACAWHQDAVAPAEYRAIVRAELALATRPVPAGVSREATP